VDCRTFKRLIFVALLAAGAAGAGAQTTVYTWTGASGDDEDLYDPNNWLNATPPPLPDSGDLPGIAAALANTELLFGPSAGGYYTYYYELYANRLTFAGIDRSYYIYGDWDTTFLGTGGIVYQPDGDITSFLQGRVELAANQTWNIADGKFVVLDPIQDDLLGYNITKTGAGTLELRSPYSDDWAGGMILVQGKVVIGPNEGDITDSLGLGPLTFSGGTLVTQPNFEYSGYDDSMIFLTNQVVSNGLISVRNGVEMAWETGGVVLAANTIMDITGRPLYIESNITETGGSRSLTLDSGGAVVLSGTNTYTGGTTVEKGVLIFATTASMPATPVTNAFAVGTLGYIGYGDDGTTSGGAPQTNPQGLFLDRFNKGATLGTVGFDTDPEQGASNFSGPINLTGFAASARLGSATHAILSGTITPQGTNYQFGGGGGYLQVSSLLTDGAGSRAVVVDSPAAAPLTLRLTNTGNSFTGGITVNNSAVILADNVSTTAALTLGAGGYIGSETSSGVQAFINRLATSVQGVIGVNSGSPVTENLSLGAFTNGAYLGTTETGYVDDGVGGGAVLQGTLTSGNGGADPYRLAGYKGGLLRVESILSGSAGVLIGNPTTPATFGDYNGRELSTVALLGNNSGLSGNVTLYGGQLFVGGPFGAPTTSLGTSTLVVQGMSLPPEWVEWDGSAPTPRLAAEWDTIIPNAITLNTKLNISPWTSMELAGKISGTGQLFMEESTYLVLSNDANDFTGGIYIGSSAELEITANHATGAGALSFGGSYGEVYFSTTNPVIRGIKDDEFYDYSYSYINLDAPDATLEINQDFDSTYSGSLRADYFDTVDRSGRFLKTGSGTLRLDSVDIYSYGLADGMGNDVSLEVQEGTVVLVDSTYIEGGVVKVSGGTLSLENAYLTVPLIVQSGMLTGGGYFYAPVTLGSGAILSPGHSPGTLSFAAGLVLQHGASMDFELQVAEGDPGVGYDTVMVSTAPLDFTAVSAGGFTLRLISLGAGGDPGNVADFSAATEYSWMLFSTTGITAFDPTKVVLDASLFTNSLDYGMGNGEFTLFQSGSDLVLRFSPVPEPSTWALLALGCGLAGLKWRRRVR
jgi:autotransporter-associated beta strand protein